MLDVMDKPKKPKGKGGRGRPAGSGREVVAFQVRIPPALNLALDAQLAKSRRTKNTEVILALEEYLQRAGLWPPPADAPEATGGEGE